MQHSDRVAIIEVAVSEHEANVVYGNGSSALGQMLHRICRRILNVFGQYAGLEPQRDEAESLDSRMNQLAATQREYWSERIRPRVLDGGSYHLLKFGESR